MSATTDTPNSSTSTENRPQKNSAEMMFQRWDLIFKAFTTLTIILGSIYGLIEYFDKRDKELAERKREYEFTLYKERKETLYPLCNAAAEIASSQTLKEAQKAIKTFETLYLGEVGIVAEGQVSEAIQAFNESLLEFKSGPKNCSPPLQLIQQSGYLPLKCKEILNLEKVYGLTRQEKQEIQAKRDSGASALRTMFIVAPE